MKIIQNIFYMDRALKLENYKCHELWIMQRSLRSARGAGSCNTRARVYPRPIALCNEIRIRSHLLARTLRDALVTRYSY